MNGLIAGIIVVFVGALALAEPGKGNSVRLGTPLAKPNTTVIGVVDPDQPGQPVSTDSIMFDAQLSKLIYDAGETVTLTTHLHTRGGTDLDGGTVSVDDRVSEGPMDHDHSDNRQHGKAKGHGQHAVILDNSAGEHHLTVSTDAVDHRGNPVHRSVGQFYVVATGDLRFLDVGTVHPEGTKLVVPLKVVSPKGGIFVISATLATDTVAVARAENQVTLEPGASTVAVYFEQSDIVEPGPYRLVEVSAQGSGETSPNFAAAPHDIGAPFQASHAQGEPPPHRDEDGHLVGGPYGSGPDLSQPPPTEVIPAPVPGHILGPGEVGYGGPGDPPVPDAPELQ